MGPSAGGMLGAAWDLARQLRQRGTPVYWLGSRPMAARGGRRDARGPRRRPAADDPEQEWVTALAWPRGLRPRPRGALEQGAAEALAALGPAIIHAHGLRASWLARALLRHRRIPPAPLLTTLHSFPFHDPELARLPTRLWRLLERRPPLPERYVCVSAALGRWLAAANPPLAARSVVIPYGRARAEHYFAERDKARQGLGLPVAPHCPLVGVLSRCSPEKGLDLLLAAFRQVAGEGGPMAGWRLVIVGDGPQLPHLRRYARREGLQGRVHFTGHVPEGARFLKAFDLCVIPSRSEGLGLTALEALAAGVPVIAAAVGGLVEALDNGRCGLLVEPRSVPALAAALARLAPDEKERRRLAAQGPAWVSRAYPTNNMVDAHLALYREVAARHGLARQGRRGQPSGRHH